MDKMISKHESVPINPVGEDANNPEDDRPAGNTCCVNPICQHWLFRFFFCPDLAMATMYGVLLGFGIGAAITDQHINPTVVTFLGYPGELFINALKMVVIPMIVCDMILAVIKLGDIKKIKLIGTRALSYYLLTTFFACVEGLIMVELWQPGVARGAASVLKNESDTFQFSETCQVTIPGTADSVSCFPVTQPKGAEDAFLDLGRSLIPPNIVVAFSNFNILGLIFFVMLYAYFVAQEEKLAVVKDFFEVSANAFMAIVMGIIWWTPLGIFSLVISTVLAEDDFWGLLASLGEFVGATTVGILFHLLIFYPIIYALTVKKNPYKMLPKMIQPMLTAFATSSSAATLPVTIKTAENNGVHKDISKFMIPLGATINMDGTAIYFPIAVIYLANTMAQNLTVGNKIAISIVSAMVSIGAAPIPNAGLVYLILIMNSVGLPITGSISFVLSIDWLLDRMQTACNVTGDGFGALILEHYRKIDEIKNPSPQRRLSEIQYLTPSDKEYVAVNDDRKSIEEH